MLETTTLTIKPTPPFSFEQTLSFIRTFRAQAFERHPAHEQLVEGALQRVVSVKGQPVLCSECGTWERWGGPSSSAPSTPKP